MKKILLFVTLAILTHQACAYTPRIPKSARPNMHTIATESRDGYDCNYIEFSTERNERIKAYLLVPHMADKKEKLPAVLMLHDHGARFDIGKEKLVKPIAATLPEKEDDHIVRSSQQWIDKYFDGVYMADSLARQGYVVLVADALYWGERSSEDAQKWSELTFGTFDLDSKARKQTIKELKKKVYEGQRNVYDSLMADGVIWAEKILRDDIASVILLKSLKYVDNDRIGAFGFSMGAHRCWMLTAFCKDVCCGVALSWMTTLDREAEMTPSDYSMAVMPMREKMDFGDIGQYLAPKQMLFLSGASDPLFPKTNVEKAYSILHSHYSDYPNRLQTEFFDGAHHCGKEVQKRIFKYINKNVRFGR